jgi:hypothetical protein
MGTSKCLPCWIRQQKDLRSLYLEVAKIIFDSDQTVRNGADGVCLSLESAAQRLSPTPRSEAGAIFGVVGSLRSRLLNLDVGRLFILENPTSGCCNI